jgi:hypothetical protein
VSASRCDSCHPDPFGLEGFKKETTDRVVTGVVLTATQTSSETPGGKYPGKSFDEVAESVPLLQRAIKEMHGCESLHIESVAVKAVFKGQIAWEGTVEVFGLIDHPKAKRAFAWAYRNGNQNKTVAVLAIPPADTAQNAVKMAIASERRAKKWRSVLAKCLPKPKNN